MQFCFGQILSRHILSIFFYGFCARLYFLAVLLCEVAHYLVQFFYQQWRWAFFEHIFYPLIFTVAFIDGYTGSIVAGAAEPLVYFYHAAKEPQNLLIVKDRAQKSPEYAGLLLSGCTFLRVGSFWCVYTSSLWSFRLQSTFRLSRHRWHRSRQHIHLFCMR